MTEHGQRLYDIMFEILEAISKKHRSPWDAIKCPKIMYLKRWGEYGWNCGDCRREFNPIYPKPSVAEDCPCLNIGPDIKHQVTREAVKIQLHKILNHIGNKM